MNSRPFSAEAPETSARMLGSDISTLDGGWQSHQSGGRSGLAASPSILAPKPGMTQRNLLDVFADEGGIAKKAGFVPAPARLRAKLHKVCYFELRVPALPRCLELLLDKTSIVFPLLRLERLL